MLGLSLGTLFASLSLSLHFGLLDAPDARSLSGDLFSISLSFPLIMVKSTGQDFTSLSLPLSLLLVLTNSVLDLVRTNDDGLEGATA